MICQKELCAFICRLTFEANALICHKYMPFDLQMGNVLCFSKGC